MLERATVVRRYCWVRQCLSGRVVGWRGVDGGARYVTKETHDPFFGQGPGRTCIKEKARTGEERYAERNRDNYCDRIRRTEDEFRVASFWWVDLSQTLGSYLR